MTTKIQYSLEEGIARVFLDDGKANVIGHELIDQLNIALDRAEGEAKALVLVGREGVFSGGFDLGEIRKGRVEAAALANRGTSLIHRLFGYPMPLVCACTGHAMAMGAFMLLSCDTRIGAKGDFKIGLNETAIGLDLTVFGRELIAHRLAKSHITQAVIQSRLYDPETAVAAGFLDEVTDSSNLMTRCMEVAKSLCMLPVDSYASMKLDVRQQALAHMKADIS